jgi:hypothetical protein
MKLKILLLSFLAVFLLVPFNQFSFAYMIDGNVDDWDINLSAATYGSSIQAVHPNTYFTHDGYLDTHLPSGVNVDYVTEDNADESSSQNTYVGPGYTHTGNTYDAEALYFDNDNLFGYIAIITGVSQTEFWKPGDIAIDFGVGGEYGYEYGIDINTDTAGLYEVSDWNNVYYSVHSSANPWAISSGTYIGDINLVYSSTAINGHYIIETSFLLSDLGLSTGDSFGIHWTMECGNDVLNLEADINPVPEPATMFLLGSGLIGLAALGRKKFRKN